MATIMRLRFKNFGANLWARAFLRNCRREMTPRLNDTRAVGQAIRRRAQALFDESFDALPDKQARSILGMCCLVLAAAEELQTSIGDAAVAFDTVRRAFASTYPTPLSWIVRVWLWFHRDPVKNLLGLSFAKLGQRMYGKSMQFADEKTDHAADMLVTRCAFHQFFVDHGRPELTVLVCAWDRAWMDVVDRSSRPIRTERLSTISTGGDCCRFRFVRDEQKHTQEPHDVVLVQLESQLAR
jgi:hypothetical protein